ncbi:MAG: ZIP family metal transporter, partial [Bacilli bacterium]
MTTLGAALVFFFKESISKNLNRIFLGFASGVMIAASVFSLLLPAIEGAEAHNIP